MGDIPLIRLWMSCAVTALLARVFAPNSECFFVPDFRPVHRLARAKDDLDAALKRGAAKGAKNKAGAAKGAENKAGAANRP